jgi:hypothetical protein
MTNDMNVDSEDASTGDITDLLFRRRAGWVELIKALRSAHSIDILDAERLALGHEGWRRWCGHQINIDPKCRKVALRHIRDHGSQSLIGRDGDELKFL